MAKSIRVILTGDEKDLSRAFKNAEADGNRFDGAMGKLTGGLKNLALGAGVAVAAGGVLAFKIGKDSVAAFMEAEKVALDYKGVLELLEPAMRPNVQVMEEWNAKLAINLALDDEAILSAQTMALRWGVTKDALKDVTINAADLAQVMKVDLDTAMGMITKAAETGGGKLFDKLGIAGFKATGDQAKDMQTVMEALEPKIAGAAAVASEGAEAGWTRLKNSLENVQSAIGGVLVETVLPALLKGLGLGDGSTTTLAASMEKFGKWIEEKGPDIATFAENLGSTFRTLGEAGAEAARVIKVAWDPFVGLMENLVKSISFVTGILPGGRKPTEMIGVGRPVQLGPEGLKYLAEHPGAGTTAPGHGWGFGGSAGGPRRQHGGPVTAGTPYWVGERGPEPFIPDSSGRILPSGGMGAAPVVNVTVMVGPEQVAAIVRSEIIRTGIANVSALGGVA